MRYLFVAAFLVLSTANAGLATWQHVANRLAHVMVAVFFGLLSIIVAVIRLRPLKP